METVSGRTLVVMRHARAESAAATDAERVLAALGRADAGATGRWLAGAVPIPDRALVSAAVRTRQTWEAVVAAAGWPVAPDLDLDAGLYAADVDAAFDLVALTDPACRSLVVVGHNPTMGQLAALLDDGEADPSVWGELLTGFPTAAAAVFGLAGDWSDLAPGAARLVASHVGRA